MSRHWQDSYDDGVPAEINAEAYKDVSALFQDAAIKFSDKPALECFGHTTSYETLETLSRNFAAYLQGSLNIKRGDRIALMAPNVPAFVIAMFGIIRAGAVQVNVNPLYTPRELKHQLNDAGAETIVVFGGVSATLAEIIDDTPITKVIGLDLGDGTQLPIPSPALDERLTDTTPLASALEMGASMELRDPGLTNADTIFFQYTGGTTGLSKGAVLSHRNIVANAEQYKAVVPQASNVGSEIMVGALPMYHIFGLMLSIAYLSLGGKIVLIPNPRDMDSFIDSIKNAKITVMPGVNTLFAGLAMHPRVNEIDFSDLKISIGGGAAVIEATSEKWKSITGKHIKEGYGLSETSPLLCINPASVEFFSGTCGLPVSSSDVKLLDENDNIAPIGERGEICCTGPQVMSGYWNNDAANAEAFTKDGYFRTGDIGIFDEAGYLKIVDRKKDMIIVSGFNVFPNEIEAIVTAADGVAECACIGVSDEKTGEAIKIFVVKSADSTITEDQLIAHCRTELTGYKIPRHVHFLTELPKSNVGKILRRELRDN
ncbi:long-chain-fatty-acid--CoA ligase [Amylibacter kogurei]|uniref:Long-chain-fatty-acid--CoA ligase n=1 Tax=Paramylibacter kogurei TaxID=1889778 RepID=A0A2G5K8Z1_9RHOB|nr:AMP-binding protein [Amylibacter kogurei]PIB26006.1 long-chain-fatty-acid--CoA ligase [Amylibacter kogurei]